MAQIKGQETDTQPAGQSREWNYHPDLPIQDAPFFEVPPKPLASIKWLINTWLKASPPVIHLVSAIMVWWLFLPTWSTMATLTLAWVFQILAINLVAAILLAGGLHFYFHTIAGQDVRLKFDIRPMETDSRRFTFNNQVLDNLFWTLAWGVPIWSALQAFYFWCAANGRAPVVDTFNSNPVWFVVLFILLRLWQSFHFYWIHRLIHHPWLFKKIHHVHHRNVNVGPWSGLSMHPVEHFLYFSAVLIFFIIPAHPIHVIFLLFSLSLGAFISHSGFDKLIIFDKEAAKAGSFHHQLHHRFFECNYGSEEIPLDRWFGSFHDGTKEATLRIRERRRKMMGG